MEDVEHMQAALSSNEDLLTELEQLAEENKSLQRKKERAEEELNEKMRSTFIDPEPTSIAPLSVKRPPESAKEIGVGPHTKTNDGTGSNVKSVAGTSSTHPDKSVHDDGATAEVRVEVTMSVGGLGSSTADFPVSGIWDKLIERSLAADSMLSREDLEEKTAEELQQMWNRTREADKEFREMERTWAQERAEKLEELLKKVAEQLHNTPKDSDLQEELEEKMVEQLHEILMDRNLHVSGIKGELIERLLQAHVTKSGSPVAADSMSSHEELKKTAEKLEGLLEKVDGELKEMQDRAQEMKEKFQNVLKARKLLTSGKKNELIERLLQAQPIKPSSPATADSASSCEELEKKIRKELKRETVGQLHDTLKDFDRQKKLEKRTVKLLHAILKDCNLLVNEIKSELIKRLLLMYHIQSVANVEELCASPQFPGLSDWIKPVTKDQLFGMLLPHGESVKSIAHTMLPRSSSSTAKSEENPVRVEDQSMSPDRLDVVQQESTNSATKTGIIYLHRQFEIPDGSTGYGYDRAFADCLDEKLTSVRVEDPYIREPHQAQNFDWFCKLLLQKCKNLERITLITSPDVWGSHEIRNPKTCETMNKIENWLMKSRIAFHVEYDPNGHDRQIYFDNGWRVKIDRGLDYFKPPNKWLRGGDGDMNLRPCKATTIIILRDKTNVNADLRSAPFESRFSGEHMIQAVVGRGRFGVVFKAQHKLDERLYAIKRVYVDDTEQSRNKVMREVHILARLDHPHIIRYGDSWLEKPPPGWQQEHDNNLLRELRSRRQQQNGEENNVPPDPKDVTQTETELLAPGSIALMFEDGRIVMVDTREITNQIRADDMNKKDTRPMVDSKLAYLYIKMEFCCGPTLHEWLGQNRLSEQRPISQTLDWFRQLVSAVKYIHDKDLIHRDINPGNIFFGSSRDGAASTLKIGGFGLATYAPASLSSGACHSIVGTEMYMSPEQSSGRYKNSTDIFSLGLVFLEMVHPFETDRKRWGAFGSFRAKRRPRVMDRLDEKMDTLISRMTEFEPKKRPTASELNDELKKMRKMSSMSEANRPKHIALASGGGRHALRRRSHAKENEDAACTSSLGAIAAVDGTGSSALKRLKLDSSSEVRISCSGTSTVPSSEHPDIGGLSIDDGILKRASFTNLPPKLMFKIFGYLYEDDLTQCTLVSRKFRAIANHQILWEPLYREVFEYSRPLLHVGHGRFEFREPHDWPQPQSDESVIVNPWKESFRQLKDGIHVRPGYASLYSGFGAGGRRLTQCDRLDQALQLVEARDENAEKLIFLHTGLHIPETTVTINSDIQIIGASIGSDIVSQVIIEGQLTTTVILAEGSQGAYLGWMTVRFAPDFGAVAVAIAAGNSRARSHHFALQICGNSTALAEHCVIHSSATVGAAVCVKGRAANPKMRHCVVCDCGNAGIYVTDAAQGQFEDCEIARNEHHGVVVEKRANPSFLRCHIYDGSHAGIFTYDHGMGYFESCNIHNNQLSGIGVANAANPTVTRCEVHHGQEGGIHVYEKGRGQFMENQIHSNAAVGIGIESHSDPKIARNKIWDNKKGGIAVIDNGQGVLEENEIFDNDIAGVGIQTDGNPTLRRNKIYDGQVTGVYITNKGRGVLEENEVYGNTFSGILVMAESSPIIRKNRIHSGKQGGVHFYDNGYGLLEENEIFDNAMAGVGIETGSNPKITRNKIWGNQQTGIAVINNGQGVLEENEIFDNDMAEVGIQTDGNPMLRCNKIYNGRYVGVYVSNKGRGLIEDNEVYGNTFAGISVTTGSSPIIRKNRIHSDKAWGVYFCDNGQGVLEENDIFDHLHSGVYIITGSNPKITRNKIRGNQKGGVLIYDNGQGVLEENEIFDNALLEVGIEADGNPTLRRNKIYDGRDVGVLISSKGRGVLEGNDIYRNAQAGVLIMSESNPTLRGNRIYEGRAAGIEIRRGAMATLESNAIFHNRFGGLFLGTGVRPALRDNRVYDNDDLVEKTIAKGGCLFEISSWTSSIMHDFYRCDTCNTTEEDAICLNCIRTCHAGHTVRLVRCGSFFCCCGAGMLEHQCKLQSELSDVDVKEIHEKRQSMLDHVAGPSSSAQRPIPPSSTLFACDDIELVHDLFGEEKPLKKSRQENEVRRALQGIDNKDERLLVQIYLDNGTEDASRAMAVLCELYGDNDATGQMESILISRLMSFGHVKHFDRLLERLGIDLNDVTPRVNERLVDVVLAHTTLLSRISSFSYRLRQVFESVDGRIHPGEKTLLASKLSPVFYEEKEQASLSTRTIRDVLLLKKPGSGMQLRDDNELKYTLVRVEGANGQMLHQTVFSSNATIRSVLDRYQLVDSSACGLKHRDKVLDLENGTLSGYRFAPAVYLVAIRNNQ